MRPGRFTIKGVSPGRYRLTVMGGMPSGHSLASAVFGGQDILDIPLEMTVPLDPPTVLLP
jgi:hypothetical protein